MIDHSGDKINFPHELLLTNRQVANLRKGSANNLTTEFNDWIYQKLNYLRW